MAVTSRSGGFGFVLKCQENSLHYSHAANRYDATSKRKHVENYFGKFEQKGTCSSSTTSGRLSLQGNWCSFGSISRFGRASFGGTGQHCYHCVTKLLSGRKCRSFVLQAARMFRLGWHFQAPGVFLRGYPARGRFLDELPSEDLDRLFGVGKGTIEYVEPVKSPE